MDIPTKDINNSTEVEAEVGIVPENGPEFGTNLADIAKTSINADEYSNFANYTD